MRSPIAPKAPRLTPRFVLVLIATLVAKAPAVVAAPKEIAAADRAELVVVIDYVRTEYVEDYSPAQLAAKCKSGMLRLEAAAQDAAALPAAGEPATSDEAAKQIADAVRKIRERSRGRFNDSQLLGACMHAMVDDLAQSAYIDRDNFKALLTEGDIGVTMRPAAKQAIVDAVAEDSPAARADLRPGDIILAVNGEPTSSLTSTDVSFRLRGEVGARLRLRVQRQGVPDPFELSLARTKVPPRTVTSQVLEPAVGYLRIPQFVVDTPDKVAATLGALDTLGVKDGLILDLRGNQGGLLRACIGVAALFLPVDAVILRTQSRARSRSETFLANPQFYKRDHAPDPVPSTPKHMRELPMVVLVDGSTASGAEALAGALQDYKRAVVLGENTAGQGTMFTIFPTGNNSALKLATARMVRPNGTQVGNGGVKPDGYLAQDAPNSVTSKDIPTGKDPLVQLAVKLLTAPR